MIDIDASMRKLRFLREIQDCKIKIADIEDVHKTMSEDAEKLEEGISGYSTDDQQVADVRFQARQLREAAAQLERQKAALQTKLDRAKLLLREAEFALKESLQS